MGLFENYYAAIKTVHIACVVFSGSLFFLRGIWLIQQSSLLQLRVIRIAPHVIDTILLISAILLCIAIQQYPFIDGWLTAKVLALLLYIYLGMIALRHHRSRQAAITSWIAALIVFSYIVFAAISHSAILGFGA